MALRVDPFEAVPRLSEPLGELSFSGQSALGFSKILLVEGPTEVKAVQQFLRAYRKDHQVVLLPLWGGNMIWGGMQDQTREIKRIANDVAALIDSERQAAGDPLDADRTGFVRIVSPSEFRARSLIDGQSKTTSRPRQYSERLAGITPH